MKKISKMIKLRGKVAIPKTLFKAIILLQVLLGRYFKLSQSKLICVFIKLYCIVFSSAVCIMIYTYSKFETFFDYMVYLEYSCNVITSLVYSDKYFHDFYNSIRTNDRIIGFKKVPLFNKYLYIIIIIYISIRFLIIVNRFFLIPADLYVFVPMTIMWTCLDLNHIFVFIIFSMLRSRMRLLRYFVESIPIPINFIGQNEIAISRMHIRKYLYYYNNLLDNMEFVNKQVQYQVIAFLVFGLPKLIFLSKTAVILFFKHLKFLLIMLVIPETFHILSDMSYPAIVVAAITYEVDKIREALTKQLVRCSDESLHWELETTLQYVSLRPFKYSICRAVSLNIYLPFTIISLCITYVIVILQLYHFTL